MQHLPHTVVLRRKITVIVIMLKRINASIGKIRIRFTNFIKIDLQIMYIYLKQRKLFNRKIIATFSY